METLDCSVPGCGTNSPKNEQTIHLFHKIPGNIEFKIKWFQALGFLNEKGECLFEGSTANALVCWNHFKKSDYRLEKGGVKRLKANTVPTYRCKCDQENGEKLHKTKNLAFPNKRMTDCEHYQSEFNKRQKLDVDEAPSTSGHAVYIKCEPTDEYYDENEPNPMPIVVKTEVEQVCIKEEPMEDNCASTSVQTIAATYQNVGIQNNDHAYAKPPTTIDILPATVKEEITIEEPKLTYVDGGCQTNVKVKKERYSVGVQTTFEEEDADGNEPENLEDTPEMKEKIEIVRRALKRLNGYTETFPQFVKSLEIDEKKSKFYTKLTHSQLLDFFALLTPKEPLEEPTDLEPLEQLVLLMTRLCSAQSASDLRFRFDIALSVCKAVFNSWVQQAFNAFRTLNEREKAQRSNVIVVNCIRFNFQSASPIPSFSSVPHEICNVLIGSEPNGRVWFVSEPLSNTLNEQELIKQLEIRRFVDKNDLVVPGKQFSIMDRNPDKYEAWKCAAFNANGRKLNQNQLKTLDAILKDEKALLGVCGRLREFRLLKRILLAHMKANLQQIVYVCCHLLLKYCSN